MEAMVASIHKENFTEQAKMYMLLHVMEIICNSLSPSFSLFLSPIVHRQ